MSFGVGNQATTTAPLTESSAANLVHQSFDEYEVSEQQMSEFTNRFLWALKQSWPAADENITHV